MKRHFYFAAILLIGLSQIVFAQSNEKDYSLETISQTLRRYKIVSLEDFHDGIAKMQIEKNGNLYWGMINKEGAIIIPFEYRSMGEYNDGLIPILSTNGWGYADKEGNIIISCQLREAHKFSEGLAAVQTDEDGKKNSWRYIDKKGNTIIPPIDRLERVGEFHNGVAPIGFNDEKSRCESTYLIDNKGKIVMPSKTIRCFNYNDGLYLVRYEDGPNRRKYGMMNKDGIMMVPAKYKDKLSFSDGLIAVRDNEGNFGYIDSDGKTIIPYQFDMAAEFNNGLALILKNGKCGYINKTGEIVISCQFESAKGFSEGFAAVCKNGKWGYVNMEGNIVIPCNYERAYVFSEGLAVVELEGKYGIIDKEGNSTFDYYK